MFKGACSQKHQVSLCLCCLVPADNRLFMLLHASSVFGFSSVPPKFRPLFFLLEANQQMLKMVVVKIFGVLFK